MPASRPGKRPLPPWMRPLGERMSPTIRNLMIAEAALFAFFVMVPPLRAVIREHLALGPRLLSGEVWQLVTSPFVHVEPVSFIMNMIGLWFVGASVERLLGRRRFFLLFFGTAIAENLVLAGLMAAFGVQEHLAPGTPQAGQLGTEIMVVFGNPVQNAGCGDAVLALIVAIGVVYGRTPLRFWGQLVLQARLLAWILVGWTVLSLLFQAAWPYLIATLVSQGAAYLLSGGKLGVVSEFLAGWRGKSGRRFDVLDGGRKDKDKNKNKYVN